MKERRRHPRVEMEVPVILRLKGRDLPASSVDLSLGGVCLLTDFNEKISKSNVEVVLDLSPHFEEISLKGKILRFEKGIGQRVSLQFTDTPAGSHKTLKKFLAARG